VKRLLPLLLATTALAACSVRPDPITPTEHLQRARDDFKALYADFVALPATLTLEEAIARALKYNYDTQLAKTEITLQDKQFDLAYTQILPKLAADAGYDWRNNDAASTSVSELTKQQSLESSYSTQREHETGDLTFTWNLLDAGVSYFQARQQGYRAFIAIERRRKVINNIVKETRATYWKAMTAQRLLPQIEPVLADAEKVLENSRQANRDSLQPPLQALEFQQNMLQVVGQLRRIRTELMSAKAQLSALINAPPTANLKLAQDTQAEKPVQVAGFDIPKLEELGLALRPELREEAYQERVDRQNVYKEMIKMMPGVSMLGSINYDSNRYYFNNIWSELGVRASYNLVNLYQGPKAIDAAQAGVDVSRVRRLALSVAVLTQINLAYQQLLRSGEMLETATAIDDVNRKISQVVQGAASADAQSESDRIRRFLSATAAELEKDRAFSEVHASLGNLYAAIGVDLVPPTVDTDDLSSLTGKVKTAISEWEAGRLPPLPELPAEEGDKDKAAAAKPIEPVTAAVVTEPPKVEVVAAAVEPPAPVVQEQPTPPQANAIALLATVGSQEAATREWQRLVHFSPDLRDRQPSYRTVVVAGRGETISLRVEGEAGDLRRMCDELKPKAPSCRVLYNPTGKGA